MAFPVCVECDESLTNGYVLCGACGMQSYCSPRCQQKHWSAGEHARRCPRSLSVETAASAGRGSDDGRDDDGHYKQVYQHDFSANVRTRPLETWRRAIDEAQETFRAAVMQVWSPRAVPNLSVPAAMNVMMVRFPDQTVQWLASSEIERRRLGVPNVFDGAVDSLDLDAVDVAGNSTAAWLLFTGNYSAYTRAFGIAEWPRGDARADAQERAATLRRRLNVANASGVLPVHWAIFRLSSPTAMLTVAAQTADEPTLRDILKRPLMGDTSALTLAVLGRFPNDSTNVLAGLLGLGFREDAIAYAVQNKQALSAAIRSGREASVEALMNNIIGWAHTYGESDEHPAMLAVRFGFMNIARMLDEQRRLLDNTLGGVSRTYRTIDGERMTIDAYERALAQPADALPPTPELEPFEPHQSPPDLYESPPSPLRPIAFRPPSSPPPPLASLPSSPVESGAETLPDADDEFGRWYTEEALTYPDDTLVAAGVTNQPYAALTPTQRDVVQAAYAEFRPFRASFDAWISEQPGEYLDRHGVRRADASFWGVRTTADAQLGHLVADWDVAMHEDDDSDFTLTDDDDLAASDDDETQPATDDDEMIDDEAQPTAADFKERAPHEAALQAALSVALGEFVRRSASTAVLERVGVRRDTRIGDMTPEQLVQLEAAMDEFMAGGSGDDDASPVRRKRVRREDIVPESGVLRGVRAALRALNKQRRTGAFDAIVSELVAGADSVRPLEDAELLRTATRSAPVDADMAKLSIALQKQVRAWNRASSNKRQRQKSPPSPPHRFSPERAATQ